MASTGNQTLVGYKSRFRAGVADMHHSLSNLLGLFEPDRIGLP
jgi:hypothetical protein